jgi:hypothetical protein
VTDVPETKYAKLGEDRIAYQVLGEGPPSMVFMIGSLAEPREVLVSSTVKDLVAGSRIDFVDRGEHQLKGVPGAWRLYRAMS